MISVRYLALAATLLLPPGCSPSERSIPLEPATSVNVERASGGVVRPFHGSFLGQLTFIPPFQPGSRSDCNAKFSGDPAHP